MAGGTVGGGFNNISGEGGTVGGGSSNSASLFATVGGGEGNFARETWSTVGGGLSNLASGFQATVVGGTGNNAAEVNATVGGGQSNCAGGRLSWAGGNRVKVRPGDDFFSGLGPACSGLPVAGSAGDAGTFIWADQQNSDFVSSGINQFLVRANGGAVITGSSATNDPLGNRLRVAGLLRVDGLGTAGGVALCRNSASQLALCSSSQRYKDNIEDIDGSEAVRLLDSLRPVRYRWIEDGRSDIGMVAEEVAELLPEIITYNEDGLIEGFQYDRLGPLLVAGFQEHAVSTEIRLLDLAADNAALRDELAGLRAAQERQQAELIELRAMVEALLQGAR